MNMKNWNIGVGHIGIPTSSFEKTVALLYRYRRSLCLGL